MAVTVTLNCADPAGVAVSYATAAIPSHGTLSALGTATGRATYTPVGGFSGADTFTYLATSVNGAAAPATVTISVSSSATSGGAGGGSGGSGGPSGSAVPAGTVLPVITNARMTNRRFRLAPGTTAVSARRAPRGTAFAFRLSTPSRLRIVLARSLPGRRTGRRCVAPALRLVRSHARRCTRLVAAGTLTRVLEPAGADAVAFTGRVGKHALPEGSYQATLVATNSVGSSKPSTLTFTITH